MTEHAAARVHGKPDLSTLDIVAGLSDDQILDIFRQTCVNRHFEIAVAEAFDRKLIQMPIYLSLGQEHVPAAVAAVFHQPLIFAQHRAHSYYLSFGGPMRKLIDELLHRETGCAGGMGGSASIHEPSIGMFGHSGLMGDQVPIAVGAALGGDRPVLTVVGDASAEEDYVYGAMGYAATKGLPVLFLCEDNNLSILTEVEKRRTWDMVGVASGLGMEAVEIADDDPWLIARTVEQLLDKLPALVNVHVCRHRWHAGTGTDGEPAWNRFEMSKKKLAARFSAAAVEEIETAAEEQVRAVWAEQLAEKQ